MKRHPNCQCLPYRLWFWRIAYWLAFMFAFMLVLAETTEDVDSEGNPLLFEKEEHNCTYFYNARSPSPEAGLVNCTWYTSKSCCKRTEVTSVFAAMDPLYGASELCRNYINYLMCFFCSPDQEKFYKLNRVHVCLDYCEALYEECRSAGFNKILIGEAYANGTSFCEAQNFAVVENAECFKFNPNVFGGASSLTPMSLQILLIFFVLCAQNSFFSGF
ncbi:voltage-dependent calcium channel subunit alpha-2/delta-3-like [Plakobranchus ocellatus]|uniref:Voltage-dependent calcium channel subunit alpha-2/delta-3-like n=1 Tax=Plakobranchus ocellatus TaxID=259542 RepID=A0AAV3XWZ4_9GAST|nr:voltage-dependent calcium channel subunit alpha-2/delta-3-like [Plakobranchus ocellatus]